MPLRCPQCGSTQLTPVGNPSILDGKRSLQCQECQTTLAPPRSIILLWLLVVAFSVLAIGMGGVMVWMLSEGKFDAHLSWHCVVSFIAVWVILWEMGRQRAVKD
jgi:hypothetical protein